MFKDFVDISETRRMTSFDKFCLCQSDFGHLMANDINSHLWSLLYKLFISEAMSGTGHDLTQVQDEGLLNTVPVGPGLHLTHHSIHLVFTRSRWEGKRNEAWHSGSKLSFQKERSDCQMHYYFLTLLFLISNCASLLQG